MQLALTRRLRVVPGLLLRLPVNQHPHPRLPPRHRSRLHAQSIDPICSMFLGSLGVSIYVDFVAVGGERLTRAMPLCKEAAGFYGDDDDD